MNLYKFVIFVKYLYLNKYMMSNALQTSLLSKEIIFVLFCNVNTFDPEKREFVDRNVESCEFAEKTKRGTNLEIQLNNLHFY